MSLLNLQISYNSTYLLFYVHYSDFSIFVLLLISFCVFSHMVSTLQYICQYSISIEFTLLLFCLFVIQVSALYQESYPAHISVLYIFAFVFLMISLFPSIGCSCLIHIAVVSIRFLFFLPFATSYIIISLRYKNCTLPLISRPLATSKPLTFSLWPSILFHWSLLTILLFVLIMCKA